MATTREKWLLTLSFFLSACASYGAAKFVDTMTWDLWRAFIDHRLRHDYSDASWMATVGLVTFFTTLWFCLKALDAINYELNKQLYKDWESYEEKDGWKIHRFNEPQ